MNSQITKPLALIILDGWGHSTEPRGNAIARAHTPYYDEIRSMYPMTTLAAAGEAVGQSPHSGGNAEIGHMTIGTGRSSRSESDRLLESIRSGSFFNNEVLVKAFAELAASGKALHLMGLMSDGGVHSSTESLFALLRMAKRAQIENVYVHCILDGVDVDPRTADVYVEALEIKLADIGVGRIATLCGRHFAMDSRLKWERTARAFTMLVHGEGERSTDAVTSIRNSFLRGISDEFIAPIVIENEPHMPAARISHGDTIIFFNHRPEGLRQLVRSVSVPDALRAAKPMINTVCLTEYDRDFELPVAFPATRVENVLSDVLSDAGIPSVKISQSERFPHVTYYFNGGSDEARESESHILVPTPRSNKAELQPESQSFKIVDNFLKAAKRDPGGVFVINIPAADLAVATGEFETAIHAVQFMDTCIGGIVRFVNKTGGAAILTSSHAACEAMSGLERDMINGPNPVPFHLISPSNGFRFREGGSLTDIAPTLLGILGMEKPEQMTGSDLRMY